MAGEYPYPDAFRYWAEVIFWFIGAMAFIGAGMQLGNWLTFALLVGIGFGAQQIALQDQVERVKEKYDVQEVDAEGTGA